MVYIALVYYTSIHTSQLIRHFLVRSFVICASVRLHTLACVGREYNALLCFYHTTRILQRSK